MPGERAGGFEGTETAGGVAINIDATLVEAAGVVDGDVVGALQAESRAGFSEDERRFAGRREVLWIAGSIELADHAVVVVERIDRPGRLLHREALQVGERPGGGAGAVEGVEIGVELGGSGAAGTQDQGRKKDQQEERSRLCRSGESRLRVSQFGTPRPHGPGFGSPNYPMQNSQAACAVLLPFSPVELTVNPQIGTWCATCLVLHYEPLQTLMSRFSLNFHSRWPDK